MIIRKRKEKERERKERKENYFVLYLKKRNEKKKTGSYLK